MEAIDLYTFAPKVDERGKQILSQRSDPLRGCVTEPPTFTREALFELEQTHRRGCYLRSNEAHRESGVVVDVEGEYRVCPWLEWSEESASVENAEERFGALFLEHDRFRHEPIRVEGSYDEPEYPILKSWFLIGRAAVRPDDGEMNRLTDFRQELVTEYAVNGRIPSRNIIALTTLRDALEDQVRRYAEQAEGIYNRVQNVLRVVAVETASRTERYGLDSLWNEGRGGVRFLLRKVWRGVSLGYPLERMTGTPSFHKMDELLLDRAKPPLLGTTARRGMIFYLSRRDSLLEEAILIDRKRLILEQLLYAAQRGGRVSAPQRESARNPFENGNGSYDHVQDIIDAYREGTDSNRPMRKMKHLKRELGGNPGTPMRAARRVINRSEQSYEKRNLFSFVTTLQEILNDYNDIL